MPAWAAIIIGLGSGVASGSLGTWATISHQRRAEFRTRMIEAAEELVAAVSRAMAAGRVVMHEVARIEHEEGMGAAAGTEPVETSMRAYNEIVDEVGVRAMRVSLLFGLHEAAVEASKFGALLGAMRGAMWNEIYHREGPDTDDAYAILLGQCGAFIEKARAEIRRPAWRREHFSDAPTIRLPDDTEQVRASE